MIFEFLIMGVRMVIAFALFFLLEMGVTHVGILRDMFLWP